MGTLLFENRPETHLAQNPASDTNTQAVFQWEATELGRKKVDLLPHIGLLSQVAALSPDW